MSKEIVTVQIGTYANHIGTHFWNLEDQYRNNTGEGSELSHATFFRQHTNERGALKYVPRTVVLDTQRGLGALDDLGTVFSRNRKVDRSKPPDVYTWSGRIKLCQNSQVNLNPYQTAFGEQREEEVAPTIPTQQTENGASKLDGNVRYWSDFMQFDFHERSLYTLNHQAELSQPFEDFSYGTELFDSYEKAEGFLDNIRFFTEECDSLQGFHAFGDDTNAFGGITSQVLRFLRDDFSSKSIMYFPVTPQISNLEEDTMNNRKTRFNHLLTQCNSWDLIDSITPINVNHWINQRATVNLDSSQKFHTSALIGGSLHTVSAPYRQRGGGGVLKGMLQGLVLRPSLKMSVLSSSFPLPARPIDELFSLPDSENSVHTGLGHAPFMLNLSHQLDQPVVSEVEGKLRLISEWGVLRGSSVHMKDNDSHKLFQKWQDRSYPCYSRAGVFLDDPSYIPIPFPFKPSLNPQTPVASAAAMFTDTAQHTHMQHDCETFEFLTRKGETRRIRQDMSVDEIIEIRELLNNIQEAYQSP